MSAILVIVGILAIVWLADYLYQVTRRIE